MTDTGLRPREQAILTEIIEYYITNHEPVSARTLSKISHLSLSPTSIRNLMEDLSDAGYLAQRDGARGRLPTRKAFYIYISDVCGRSAAPQTPRAPRPAADAESLQSCLARSGRLLAEQSGYASVACLPPRDAYPLEWVRLAAIDDARILVNIGTPFGDVWSKLVAAGEPFAPQAIAELESYLNRAFRGKPLAEVRGAIMAGAPLPQLEDALPLGAAFRMLRKAFEWEEPPVRHVWGEAALLAVKELAEPEKMLRVHGALHDPAFLSLAGRNAREVDGGLVAIGSEMGVAGVEELALVVFPFGWDAAHAGAIAVVGPLHMDYSQVVQLVSAHAGELNRNLHAALAGSAGAG